MVEEGHHTRGATHDGVDLLLLLHPVLCLPECFLDLVVAHLVVVIAQPEFKVCIFSKHTIILIDHAKLLKRTLSPRQDGLLFRIVELWLLAMDELVQHLRQVNFDKVGNEVSVGSVAIANPHHPVICNVGKVLLYYIGILIRFLLSRNKSLSRLYSVSNYRSFALILLHSDLVAILDQL